MLVAPSAPRDVTASSPDFSTISLTWTVPSTLNGIIKNYRIMYSLTGQDNMPPRSIETGNAMLEFNITSGLTAFTNYSISVTAITVVAGSPSDTITVVTNENGEPSP